MSDAAEARALRAEARDASKYWEHHGKLGTASLLGRLADALEAAHAEPDDDEREALIRLLDERLNWGQGIEFPVSVIEKIADAILATGFRRSARVPVSRDELRRIVLEQLERNDSIARVARSTVIVDALLATQDIYPKADRKPADSGDAGL